MDLTLNNSRYCGECGVVRYLSHFSSRRKHLNRRRLPPNDFVTYTTQRFEALSEEARMDFMMHPWKLQLFKALWKAQYEEARGNDEEAKDAWDMAKSEANALLASFTAVPDLRGE